MEFTIKATFNTTTEALFKAWLDSDSHTAMTGGAAEASDQTGAAFTSWDGYIEGKNIELVLYQRIVQSWRAAEFEASHEDSILTLHFEPEGDQTELTLTHSNLPDSIGEQYRQGWLDHYFTPMQAYFT